MNAELKNLIERIDFLKKEIDAMRPLPPDLEGKIMQKFRLDWNFHSNAIEGNSLTYGETIAFLMEGLTAKGKPLKDHLDLRGHGEAIEFLQIFIKNGEELTERDIRELHKMILVEPYSNPAQTPHGQIVPKKVNLGQYKTSANHVKTASGEMFYFASPEETPARMHDLMTWYRENRTEKHPLELAAIFHYEFVRIHPFDDGNGRMSRLLMNFILMQFGYPPVVIKTRKKVDYYYALREADSGNINGFIQYIGEELLHSMDLYLKGAKGESIEEQGDIEKELELLVLERQAKSTRDDVAVLKIINELVLPFYDFLEQKAGRLKSLFVSGGIGPQLFLGNSGGISSGRNLISNIGSDYKTELVRKIIISYRLNDYIANGKSNGFNVEVHVNFEFDETDLTVQIDQNDNHSFNFNVPISHIFYYNAPISKNWPEQLTNSVLRLLIDDVKRKSA